MATIRGSDMKAYNGDFFCKTAVGRVLMVYPNKYYVCKFIAGDKILFDSEYTILKMYNNVSDDNIYINHRCIPYDINYIKCIDMNISKSVTPSECQIFIDKCIDDGMIMVVSELWRKHQVELYDNMYSNLRLNTIMKNKCKGYHNTIIKRSESKIKDAPSTTKLDHIINNIRNKRDYRRDMSDRRNYDKIDDRRDYRRDYTRDYRRDYDDMGDRRDYDDMGDMDDMGNYNDRVDRSNYINYREDRDRRDVVIKNNDRRDVVIVNKDCCKKPCGDKRKVILVNTDILPKRLLNDGYQSDYENRHNVKRIRYNLNLNEKEEGEI